MLILDQSAPLRPWSTAIINAMQSAIKTHPRGPITHYVEHLDMFGFYSPQYEDTLRAHFRAKYRGRPIGVIVSIGPSALDVGVNLRATLWPTVPVVFAAVEESGAPHQLPPNTTGLVYPRTLAAMINASRRIVPNVKQFVIVGDPIAYETYERHLFNEIPQLSTEFGIIELLGLPVKELTRRVTSLPADSIILYLGINADGETRFSSAVEVLPIIAEAANRPIIVDAETALGLGAIGGFVRTPGQIGRDTAHLAMRVLDGESASAIPVIGNTLKPIFDWRQLQRWNISESNLPAGSEVRFREPTLWNQYRQWIIATMMVILVQTAFIAWLVNERLRRNRAEVLARTLMSELVQMNRTATAGELSASIAHEVNQPLCGIVANANAARRWISADVPNLDKALSLLDQIAAASYHASEIITSVRSMFKKDANERAPVDVNNIIRTVLAIARIDLERKGVELRTRLDDKLPGIIGDKVQLQQVVLNLVMNAIEAMHSVQHRVLTVQSQLRDPNILRVSIEDTGVGVEPFNLELIFQPLFTTKARGMGMGLAICLSIISSHGGRIWASPGVNGGSIFQFELPIMSTNDKGNRDGNLGSSSII